VTVSLLLVAYSCALADRQAALRMFQSQGQAVYDKGSQHRAASSATFTVHIDQLCPVPNCSVLVSSMQMACQLTQQLTAVS
jgi:hypothetical protein